MKGIQPEILIIGITLFGIAIVGTGFVLGGHVSTALIVCGFMIWIDMLIGGLRR